MPRTCSIPGCNKPHEGRGYCATHYKRWWKYGDPMTVLSKRNSDPQDPICRVKGCGRKSHAKSLCGKHYMRMITWGCPYFGIGMKPFRSPLAGRKKGSYFYSEQDMLSAYLAGDTGTSYANRTGIATQTISKRFGKWSLFVAMAKEFQARRAA